MNTRTGKRTARFRVKVVQDGESIEMSFDDNNLFARSNRRDQP
jgi:hypothetical protein